MDLTVRDLLLRYGPGTAIALVLLLLVVILPGDVRQETRGGEPENLSSLGIEQDQSGFDLGESADLSDAGLGLGDTSPTAGGAVTGGGQQVNSGSAKQTTNTSKPAAGSSASGPADRSHCRPDGRQLGISVYMPPCAAPFTGDNGGATARGVTRDKIIVARYVGQSDPAASAALFAAGISDDAETVDRSVEVLRYYFNQHVETYGREVVYVRVNASGPSDDDVAIKADAVRIADEVKAFAAFGGNMAMAKELAARGVICICAGSDSQQNYKQAAGFVFSSPLPMLEMIYAHLAEYMGKRLLGRNAVHSGDAAMQAQSRKFGLIWTSGSGSNTDPNRKLARDFFVSELSKFGATLTKDVSYNVDTANAGQQATNIIAQLKAAGVTTVTFMTDSLSMIFITKEATRQAYFPEWVHSGIATTSSTFFGRAYDQAQWIHSFGIDALWLFWTVETKSPGYLEYHHACREALGPNGECGENSEGELACCNRWTPEALFIGIMMAGPRLTAQTFAQGMYAYPVSGGTPKAPSHAYTPNNPTATKDFTEIWWDPNGVAEDEVGNTGRGRIMKVDGGKRYTLGGWPATDPKVFVEDGAVYTSDDPKYGNQVVPHVGDGHKHPNTKGCLSCAPRK